ncbi:hypothetical protein CHS0354_025127 [Potamilus streckersoni]|uniref:LsmAD domain-containing protein n=1 Tax=Potamilus streckersoni TaxID=2493646 RepID=A0AAE0RWJ6_9BIVA|nr:hypothetical protein CHS0354_025127 [Potamilus streckersoni]
MMNNTKRRGRPNQGRFERPEHKRADYFGDRSNRPRVQQPQPTEKVNEKQIINDGVYANPRFTHVLISLVGLNVQVQVKNGIIYEGILKTYSSKLEVVLELVHKVETTNGIPNIPSRDRLMDKIVLKIADVVVLNTFNVDMDFAVKDSFTDSSISKYNGEVREKDFKDLEPWESEGPDDTVPLSSEPSNGWDVDEMFRTNQEQFNVLSSYDESLAQYTTPLEKKDTEEYRRKEENATRIAKEIESSESYNRRISLENGEGDEELIYSAVVRENNNSPSSQSGTGGGGKYVPPARRNQTGPNRHQRGYYARNSPTNVSFVPQLQRQQHKQQHQNQNQHFKPSVQMSLPPGQTPLHLEAKVNGVEERKHELVAADKNSPVQEQSTKPNSPKTSTSTAPSASGTELIKVESINTSPVQSKSEVRKTPTKGRDAQIKELKEFSFKFKLGEDREKEKEMGRKIEEEERLEGAAGEEKKMENASPVPDQKENEKPQVENVSKKYDEILKNSNLNPMAKDFIYQPKVFQSKQPAQITTPPRPQTQSPIIQPMPIQVQAQPVYPSPGQPFMVPPNIMPAITQQAPTQQVFRPPPKRAVVSVQPRADLTAAAAQAATGQPLLAQANPHPNIVYFPQGIPGPQPTGYQMGQVMSMPAPNTSGHVPRFAPLVPTSHQQGNIDPSSQPPAGTGHVFMPSQHGPGAVPAHLNHPAHVTHTGHITHHPGVGPHQGQHGGQMNPQTGGHHHAPSPVHSAGPTQQQTQVHPPSSGTPQPVGGYQQGGLHPHPPLQPSPHNSASPQNMTHMQYHFTPGGPLLQGAPHLAVTQTYSLPHGPSPHMAHHQLIMMPQPPHGQLQHHHMQQATQFQGHHMSGPGPVHSQPQMIQSQSIHQAMQTSHAQGHQPAHQLHHFVPPVHGTQGAPQVQAYHHPQTQ